MRHISIILLTLPDSRIVFQRRGKQTKRSPGLLGFFGGHVEDGETADDAMSRELQEETGLDLDKLTWGFVQEATYTPDQQSEATFHLYWAEVPDADFEDLEGDGAEVYGRTEALTRSDLAPFCKHVLENVLKEK